MHRSVLGRFGHNRLYHPTADGGGSPAAPTGTGAPAAGGDPGAGDPGDGLDGGDAVTEGLSIEEEGRRYLASLSEEERTRPFAGAASDDDEGDENEGDGGDPPAKPAKPAKAAGAPPAGDEGEGEGEGDDAPPDGVVRLAGLAERGEDDIEIEVDPEVAERLRRLQNDGLRAAEYQTRRAELDTRQQALDNYREYMEIDPVGFHLDLMPAEQQIEVARALILEHLETLAPDIDKLLADPKALYDQRNAALKARREAETTIKQNRESRTAARAIMSSVEKIVPDGTPADVAQEFVADARQILARAAEAGQAVTPATVKQLLARRIALYGFNKPAAPPPPAKTGARPVTDSARRFAEAAPRKAGAAAAQARTQSTQRHRAAASRVPRPGAGAAPVQAPPVPKEAEADIASMSKHLRSSGALTEGWTPGAGR